MSLIKFEDFQGDRSLNSLAADFEIAQSALYKAVKKGRDLYVRIDRKSKTKQLIEIKVIREVAA